MARYYKIVDGHKVYFRGPLRFNGFITVNPSPELLQEAGYTLEPPPEPAPPYVPTERDKLLQEQQECLVTMQSSDAHASKCMKLGISFAETYPDEYEAYKAANTRYNQIDVLLAQMDNVESTNTQEE